MKKLIYALSLIIGLNAYSYEISEETAIEKLEEFFYLLDVDRYKKDDFFKVTTEDFQIFEDRTFCLLFRDHFGINNFF